MPFHGSPTPVCFLRNENNVGKPGGLKGWADARSLESVMEPGTQELSGMVPPGAEQGRLRLILTDRKYVLKMKCPDRLRSRQSPWRSLQSGDSGCSCSTVRSSYGDTGFRERGRCGDQAEVPSSEPQKRQEEKFWGKADQNR